MTTESNFGFLVMSLPVKKEKNPGSTLSKILLLKYMINIKFVKRFEVVFTCDDFKHVCLNYVITKRKYPIK